MDAAFIQKFHVFHGQLRNFFLKLSALAFHSRCVSLTGMEQLFLRGNLSRTNSRYIIPGSDWIPVVFSTLSHSSCNVASGWSFTAARMAASAVATEI
jgi:hypothetical protein